MDHRRIACSLLALASLVAKAAGQGVPEPAYTPLVWDENWSYLSDPALALDWSDRWQHIPLGGTSYVSFGGQLRERGETIDYPNFAAKPAHDGYLLQRYLVDSDWHAGRGFRFFLQLAGSLEDGRDGGPRPGIDRDTLSFNQIFLDYLPNDRVTVRIGRQLITLGSARLFAIGYGLNVEQPFDGVRIMLHPGQWKLDLLAVRPTQILDGYFQNKPNSQVSAWGLYASHSVNTLRNINVDLYYFGFDRRSWRWPTGSGREQRETIGARLWHDGSAWSWDLEGTPQVGRFSSEHIRAWASGYHLARHFTQRPFKPSAELDGGVTSGNHNGLNHTLGTFNPLFPNGSYLSESLLIGPSNLVIVRPKFQFNLTRKLTFAPNFEALWRQSAQDGVYNIAGVMTHSGSLSGSHFVGSQVQAGLTYAFTRHLQGSFTYEHFFPGKFLEQTPPNYPVNFAAPMLTYTF